MSGGIKILREINTEVCKRNKRRKIDLMVESVSNDDAKEEEIQMEEQSILEFAHKLSSTGRAVELGNLIKTSRPFLNQISKAKAAKLVHALVDMLSGMGADTGMQIDLCMECIEWAKQEKRTFLRQSLEARLIALYYDTEKYSDALKLGSSLLRELKKIGEKNLLVEVHLLESKIYYVLSNLPRARVALTSGKTTANEVYCPPKLQAELDMQSGILHASDEDFKTAFSYFYEAFGEYDMISSPKALVALKYMLLSKIMLNLPDEVHSLIMGKLILNYAGVEVDAMRAVAQASCNRSIADFVVALETYQRELVDDLFIKAHLSTLYDMMIEQNLCRILEPYSRIQVAIIAKRINLPLDRIESKLSQMILDKKLNGILDQGEGALILFEDAAVNKTHEICLETIQTLAKLVDVLYEKYAKLQ